ncbi:MAG TPA: GNAT family N-acetyltransferase [Solirubrobacteraceae bacterium]|nr:GNAT family N-acetyltransferase [Solirubrobacteraceae bacterium]
MSREAHAGETYSGRVSGDGVLLRPVEIADLRMILGELDDFWGERDVAFLHQALYVHEFGDTSLLAERDREIVAYLLGFVSPAARAGYVHVVAVRRSARGRGLARRLYERFAELARARGARGLKAITSPENDGSRAFHEALGFSVALVDGYSPSGGARLVFRRALDAS